MGDICVRFCKGASTFFENAEKILTNTGKSVSSSDRKDLISNAKMGALIGLVLTVSSVALALFSGVLPLLLLTPVLWDATAMLHNLSLIADTSLTESGSAKGLFQRIWSSAANKVSALWNGIDMRLFDNTTITKVIVKFTAKSN